jgi:superfamily II DNA/RNA helicase
MIFCQTRKTAAWLAEKMTKDGHAVALLSGELGVEERIRVSTLLWVGGKNNPSNIWQHPY